MNQIYSQELKENIKEALERGFFRAAIHNGIDPLNAALITKQAFDVNQLINENPKAALGIAGGLGGAGIGALAGGKKHRGKGALAGGLAGAGLGALAGSQDSVRDMLARYLPYGTHGEPGGTEGNDPAKSGISSNVVRDQPPTEPEPTPFEPYARATGAQFGPPAPVISSNVVRNQSSTEPAPKLDEPYARATGEMFGPARPFPQYGSAPEPFQPATPGEINPYTTGPLSVSENIQDRLNGLPFQPATNEETHPYTTGPLSVSENIQDRLNGLPFQQYGSAPEPFQPATPGEINPYTTGPLSVSENIQDRLDPLIRSQLLKKIPLVSELERLRAQDSTSTANQMGRNFGQTLRDAGSTLNTAKDIPSQYARIAEMEAQLRAKQKGHSFAQTLRDAGSTLNTAKDIPGQYATIAEMEARRRAKQLNRAIGSGVHAVTQPASDFLKGISGSQQPDTTQSQALRDRLNALQNR